MAETIRDVTIRVALEMKKTNLSGTGLSTVSPQLADISKNSKAVTADFNTTSTASATLVDTLTDMAGVSGGVKSGLASMTSSASAATGGFSAMVAAALPLIAVMAGVQLAVTVFARASQLAAERAAQLAQELRGLRNFVSSIGDVTHSTSGDLLKLTSGFISSAEAAQLAATRLTEFDKVSKQLTSERTEDIEALIQAFGKLKIPTAAEEAKFSLDFAKLITKEQKAQEAVNDEVAAIERQRVSFLREINQEKRTELETSKALLATEDAKNLSLRAQIGSATRIQRIQLKQAIAAKQAGKELSRFQVETLGKFFPKFGEEESAKRNQEGFSDATLREFGGITSTVRDDLTARKNLAGAAENVTVTQFLSQEMKRLLLSDTELKTELVEGMTQLTADNAVHKLELKAARDQARATANTMTPEI